DLQEIPAPQGLELLRLFHRHKAKTTILDDFAFYEKRAAQASMHYQQQ
ncbi:unnamed protein product, partial [Discosporangium mesarthrocarpum]